MRVQWIRKTHRALGLVIGVQLLLWTASGLYFSWNNIGKVRGEHLVAEPETLTPGDGAYLPPDDAIAAVTASGESIESVSRISLRPLLGDPVYEIEYRADGKTRFALVDAVGGEIRSPLGREEAVAVARADFVPDAAVIEVERVETIGRGSEYRGRELPAWRVEFDHPSGTRLYVSADRGLVRARRNTTWRAFDLLWMFHIMDYENRDDINNAVLRFLSILGVTTVVSGYVLWAVTSRTFRRRRKPIARIGDERPSS
jgi:hypothetical protein